MHADMYANTAVARQYYNLSITANSTKPGANVIDYYCTTSTNSSQAWDQENGKVGFNGLTYYQLKSEETAQAPLCLSLAAGKTAAGTSAITWNCSAGTDDQYWARVQVDDDPQGHPCYYFQNNLATQANYNGVPR